MKKEKRIQRVTIYEISKNGLRTSKECFYLSFLVKITTWWVYQFLAEREGLAIIILFFHFAFSNAENSDNSI